MNKAQILLTLPLLLLGIMTSSAQQLPQFTQYMFNTTSVNPAYAGSREAFNLTLLHRSQWAGIDGAPSTNTFSLHTPLKNERIGLGLSYIGDTYGDEGTHYIYGDISYYVPVSATAKLAFGIKGGVTNYTKDDIILEDTGEVGINSWQPNFGAGLYLTTNRWYIGASAPKILSHDINNGEFEALERQTYYGIAGLVFDLGLNVKFRPSGIVKVTNGAPITYDATASFLFYEKLWIGASYRFNDASNLGAFIDYQVTKDIRLGYGYDLPTDTIRPYTSGSHEVILIYEPWRGGNGNKNGLGKDLYKSPRYF